MTKKHFIELANTIRDENAHRESAGLPLMFDKAAQIALADFCIQQNPQFRRGRWLDYIEGRCGPNGGTIKTNPRTGMESTDPSDSLL
jgi:hypothetical protein